MNLSRNFDISAENEMSSRRQFILHWLSYSLIGLGNLHVNFRACNILVVGSFFKTDNSLSNKIIFLQKTWELDWMQPKIYEDAKNILILDTYNSRLKKRQNTSLYCMWSLY